MASIYGAWNKQLCTSLKTFCVCYIVQMCDDSTQFSIYNVKMEGNYSLCSTLWFSLLFGMGLSL